MKAARHSPLAACNNTPQALRSQDHDTIQYVLIGFCCLGVKAERGGIRMSQKKQDYITWDEYFMGVAMLSAMRSKDPGTQVGAV